MYNKIPYFTENGIKYLDIEEVNQMLSPKDDKEKLYHFTSLDSFIKIWLSQKLLFSERINMNDFAEANDMVTGNDYLKMKIYLYCITEYKQISLSRQYCKNEDEIFKSSLMWGYYANKCTGVCIELDKEKLLTNNYEGIKYDSVEYLPNIPYNTKDVDKEDIANIDDARKILDKDLHNTYFVKSKQWEFENEFRIISRTRSSLDISDCILKIYLFHANKTSQEIVFNLIDGKVDIRIICASLRHQEKILGTYPLTKELLNRKEVHFDDAEFKKLQLEDKKKNFK